MNSKNSKQKNHNRPAIIVGLLATCLILGYGFFLVAVSYPIENLSISNAGVFGDSFGVITSLFSALAFAGVLYTNSIQREEYKLQREELAEQKKELKITRNETYKQGFEDTFFQMMRLFQQTIEGLNIKQFGVAKPSNISDREVISFLERKLRSELNEYGDTTTKSLEMRLTYISSVVTRINAQNKNILMPYLRTLTNILDFISRSQIPDKTLYLNLVRSQLSDSELFLIFYNLLTNQCSELKNLVLELSIFKNLEKDCLMLPEHILFLPNSSTNFEDEIRDEFNAPY